MTGADDLPVRRAISVGFSGATERTKALRIRHQVPPGTGLTPLGAGTRQVESGIAAPTTEAAR
jgi:hypothetical protein